jgi:hypothetical protein
VEYINWCPTDISFWLLEKVVQKRSYCPKKSIKNSNCNKNPLLLCRLRETIPKRFMASEFFFDI